MELRLAAEARWPRLLLFLGQERGDGNIVSDIRKTRRRFQFSLRALLLLFIPVALLSALAARLLHPPPIDVAITVEPFSLSRYDDGAGNFPLSASVEITNMSESRVWFAGFPGSPAHVFQRLVDGKWESILYIQYAGSPRDQPAPLPWAALRSMESITILAAPISEETTEMRLGVPFTTEWFAPKGHWVFSPIVKIVKKGDDYFPEVKKETEQDEGVLPPPPMSRMSP